MFEWAWVELELARNKIFTFSEVLRVGYGNEWKSSYAYYPLLWILGNFNPTSLIDHGRYQYLLNSFIYIL